MKKKLIRWVQPIVFGLAALFIIGLLATQWGELQAYPWRLHAGWFALSALFMLVSWAIEIGLWRHILHLIANPQSKLEISHKNTKTTKEEQLAQSVHASRTTHHESRITNYAPRITPHLPFLSATRLWFLSAITRYIPGNVWQPLSLTIYCRRWGFVPEATVTSVLLYQVVLLLAAIPIAAIYFGVTRNFGLLSGYLEGVAVWLIPLGLIPLVTFLVRPDWLIVCINWGLVKIGRAPLNARLSWRDLLQLVLIAVAHWIAWGICFGALTMALSDYDFGQMLTFAPHLIAVYAIAYTIGYLSVITPSGIGVREGAFFVLLAPLMGAPAVTVAALAMRLFTTLGELFAAAISAGFDFFDRRADRQKNFPEVAAELEQGADRA